MTVIRGSVSKLLAISAISYLRTVRTQTMGNNGYIDYPQKEHCSISLHIYYLFWSVSFEEDKHEIIGCWSVRPPVLSADLHVEKTTQLKKNNINRYCFFHSI